MCGGSVFRTVKTICKLLSALSFAGAIGLLVVTYLRFHLPGRQSVFIEISMEYTDDLQLVVPLLIVMYFTFLIGWIGMEENIKIIILVYGVIMCILAVILFIYTYEIYGSNHYGIMEKAADTMSNKFQQHLDSVRNFAYWFRFGKISWHYKCCGRLNYVDFGDHTRSHTLRIWCCEPSIDLHFRIGCYYRMMWQKGCLETFLTITHQDIAWSRCVFFTVSLIWLCSGIYGIYLSILLCRPVNAAVEVQEVRRVRVK